MMQYSEEAILTVWGTSLIIGVVVIVVVGVLLKVILSTAKKIDSNVKKIWTEGMLLANNTVQIPLFLNDTNRELDTILKSTERIKEGTKIIEDHVKGCPGCPICLSSKN